MALAMCPGQPQHSIQLPMASDQSKVIHQKQDRKHPSKLGGHILTFAKTAVCKKRAAGGKKIPDKNCCLLCVSAPK